MSIGRTLTARLRGGLGNQMFQYAAARALADELGMDVVLDTRRGFQTDKVYRRTYALGKFPIRAMHATRWSEWPYAIEGIIRKLRMGHPAPEWVTKRPWGYMLTEREYVYFAGAFELKPDRNIWMNGFWQSEKYFASRRDAILRDFELPEPESRHCLEMARRIEGSNAVAVGVRLFEEMPATDDRSAVGGVVPWSYYERAARLVCEQLANPTFFVFCTKRRGVEGRINLPGKSTTLRRMKGLETNLRRFGSLAAAEAISCRIVRFTGGAPGSVRGEGAAPSSSRATSFRTRTQYRLGGSRTRKYRARPGERLRHDQAAFAKAASVVAVLTLVSKLLGFLRETSLAAVFGATAETVYLILSNRAK